MMAATEQRDSSIIAGCEYRLFSGYFKSANTPNNRQFSAWL